jgi:hypothetical protein
MRIKIPHNLEVDIVCIHLKSYKTLKLTNARAVTVSLDALHSHKSVCQTATMHVTARCSCSMSPSTLAATEELRLTVHRVIRQYRVHSVVYLSPIVLAVIHNHPTTLSLSLSLSLSCCSHFGA